MDQAPASYAAGAQLTREAIGNFDASASLTFATAAPAKADSLTYRKVGQEERAKAAIRSAAALARTSCL